MNDSQLTAADVLEKYARKGHETDCHFSRDYGFLPAGAPLLAMADSHVAWDQVIDQLPALFRDVTVCETLESELPLLDAKSAALDDRYLSRAALQLGVLAHAYVRNHPQEQPQLPRAIEQPWIEVCRRMGRPSAALTFTDLLAYNWRLTDRTGDRVVENLDLLTPTVGNEEERVAYMTITESLHRSGDLICAAIDAEKAIERNSIDDLKIVLTKLRDVLYDITFGTFLKMDPNPWSATYCDPVIWAKTVAPFAASTREGEPGVSGASSPNFQLMDTLFGRIAYRTTISEESREFRTWLPKGYQQFFAAVTRIGLRDFVASSGDTELRGLFQAALDAYAGERGFLGVHRLKMYGYMELGFKAGRMATNGGFSSEVGPRAWDMLDDQVEKTRLERYDGISLTTHKARRACVERTGEAGHSEARRIVLDVKGIGLGYRAGDRCAVWPRNEPTLIDRTLKALKAHGDEAIGLTQAWKSSLARDYGVAIEDSMPLGEFLSYARIRPVDRAVGKQLDALTRSPALHDILERRREDQHELWDVLELLADANYDVRRLWKARPWEQDSLARIVPCERRRLYSISSAERKDERGNAAELALTVGALSYDTQTVAGRRGAASTYLNRSLSVAEEALPIRVHRPSRFSLPSDPARPIVMFAAGTGIAPFIGHFEARARQSAATSTLFFSTRSPETLYCREQLNELAQRDPNCQIYVKFSRSPKRVEITSQSKTRRIELQDDQPGRIDVLLSAPKIRAQLKKWMLPVSEGGEQASFFVCGQTGFAAVVLQQLRTALGPEPEMDEVFNRMVGECRMMLDVFTTFAPETAPGLRGNKSFDASEVVLHNNAEDGFWTIINGQVFDLTEFLALHPGGDKILISSAGMDGTRPYEKIEHQLNSEVHAQLDLYKIGAIRRLDFKDEWGVALTADGLKAIDLSDVYRQWIRFVYKIVEMENAITNDFEIHSHALTRVEGAAEPTPMKTELLLETHHRVMNHFVVELLGADLQLLWSYLTGLAAQNERLDRIKFESLAVERSAEAKSVFNVSEAVLKAMIEARSEGEVWDANPDIARTREVVEELDRCLFRDLKLLLRKGLLEFEQFEHNTIRERGHELLNVLLEVPGTVGQFLRAMRRALPGSFV